MKNFIEVTLTQNKARMLISVSSISGVEEFPQFKSRIIMKEIVESTGTNLVALVDQSYLEVKNLMQSAQKA